MRLLEHYGSYLQTSDLQFCFKKGVGCSHAIFVVRAVVDYFTRYGSSVNLCALETFDKVNHYALFNKLMNVMLCYVIWLFVRRLSQEAIQRRSQRDRLVKIKVFKLR